MIKPHVFLKSVFPPCNTTLDRYDHKHDFWQIISVASGNGTIRLDGKEFPLSQGNIIFIAPDILHSFWADTTALTTYEIKFSITDEFLSNIANNIYPCVNTPCEPISQLIKIIVHEARDKKTFSAEIIKHQIAELILLYARHYCNISDVSNSDDSRQSNDADALDSLIMQVKEYIDIHYTQPIELSDIAGKFFISRESLCRRFSDSFKVSPKKYINLLKIQKAKELLETTDMSITEISEFIGFSSIHYFSRKFTSIVKSSPSEYKIAKRGGYFINAE